MLRHEVEGTELERMLQIASRHLAYRNSSDEHRSAWTDHGKHADTKGTHEAAVRCARLRNWTFAGDRPCRRKDRGHLGEDRRYKVHPPGCDRAPSPWDVGGEAAGGGVAGGGGAPWSRGRIARSLRSLSRDGSIVENVRAERT